MMLKRSEDSYRRAKIIGIRLNEGFALLVMGLIISGMAQQRIVQSVKEVSAAKWRAQQNANEVRVLRSLLTDAETGQRGFLLTGAADYLTPYESAVLDIPTTIERLRGSFAGQPLQLKQVDQIKKLAESKLEELALTVELKQSEGTAAALQVVNENRGRIYMSEMRTLLNLIDNEQIAEVASIQSRIDQMGQWSNWLGYGGNSLAGFLVVLLTFIYYRNQKLRRITELGLLDQNRKLDAQRHILNKVILAQNQVATAEMNSVTIMELVVNHAIELTEADGAIIEVPDGDDVLLYKHVSGVAKKFSGMKIKREKSFSGLCLAEDHPLICFDSETDKRVDRDACRRVGLRSMVVVPLRHRDRVIGVLKVFSSQAHFFNDQTSTTLLLFSGLVSAALNQASSYEEKVAAVVELEAAKSALTVSRDQAQSATHAKTLFLANMSHELRTPLNGVLGMTGILLDGPLNDEQRDHAMAIRSSGEALLRLVNDVLDFSKIEAGQLDFENVDFDLTSTLQDVMRAFRFEAGKKDLGLNLITDPGVPTYLNGDPGRIRQILNNLIGNALKFTAKGSVSVGVSCVDLRDETAELRFEIKDTGIGIPAEKVSAMFREFSQGDASMSRRFGGTGLGLTISKRLVENMNGTIDFSSTAGEGSVFWFTLRLPIGSAMKKQVQLETAQAVFATEASLPILVAEDNEFNQIVITKMLQKLGFTARVVGNGKLALDALKAEEYELILMDCQMPIMDGFEATQLIRQAPSQSTLPIIAMTANAMKEDRERCLAGGMDDYISKPLVLDKLATILTKWTTKRQAERSAV